MSIYIKKVGYQEDFVYDFVCGNCHCEWSADADETTLSSNRYDLYQYGEYTRVMPCPCCGRTVSSYDTRTIKENMILRHRDDGYLFVDE